MMLSTRSNTLAEPVGRTHPTWFGLLPPRIQDVLEGVYAVVDAGATTLAVGGLRVLVELVARDGAGNVSSMRERLDALCTRGLISAQQRDWLKTVVSHGNAALHEGVTVSKEDLLHLLLCVEHLLVGYFVLPRPMSPPQE